MALAQGSRSRLAYGVETTFGTAASTYKNLPVNTHSLNLTKDRVAGNEIQPDRMPRVDRHGNRQVGGDIVVDLRDGDYDDLIKSAMLSDWSSDVIKIGTTPTFLTIEDYLSDIDQARLFTGMAANTMAVSLAPNQMVTTTFGMVGKDMSISATEKTVSDASGAAPFDAYSGDLSIGDVGASSAVSIITAMDFTLTNSLNPRFVIGDDTTPSLEYGRAEIEGSITAYFEDEALINRFLNETETEIEVSVNDPTGANAYTFLFPRVKLNTGDAPLEGPASRMVTLNFVALYDSTEGSNLVITRPASV